MGRWWRKVNALEGGKFRRVEAVEGGEGEKGRGIPKELKRFIIPSPFCLNSLK